MEEIDIARKKKKVMPSPLEMKQIIFTTEEPLLMKNMLSWDILKWSLDEWVKNLENPKLDFRIGTKQCTKVPQWENSCEIISASLSEVLDKNNEKLSDIWMYFDYKHMNQYFKNKPELLKALSWADFGFPEKSGKDSTIWIGTKGACTPCHMDSYGCNIVAQIHGRKLWVLFPPNKTPVLKPTRVPYEESSIYSNINFSCGRNISDDIGEARVIELSPGDVLVIPKHWWHYVENLTTAVSINMWIPLESDDSSRLEEALVRFSIATILKGLEIDGNSSLLNPNEIDLVDETVDLRQISWCVDQVVAKGGHEEAASRVEESSSDSRQGCVSSVPRLSSAELRQILLNKCSCTEDSDISDYETPKPKTLLAEHVINAFCHPSVISQVAKLLVVMRKE